MKLLACLPPLALLAACSSTPPAMGSADAPAARADTPVPEWNDTGSVWGYLASKYDADGDGSVTTTEYTRGDESFARLDNDADGILTEADFPPGSEEDSQEMFRLRFARSVVERYLQDDADPNQLTLDELFLAAEAYDRNGDELLVEDEFRALASSRVQEPPIPAEVRMMGEFDPWEALTVALDDDQDGALSFAELGMFFEAQDDDADFIWNLEPLDAAMSLDNKEPASGPRAGTVAPDFELSPPDGGDPVRLSSFAGVRPVALIFGSAT